MQHNLTDLKFDPTPGEVIAEAMLTRSRLYHIEPIGIGTPYVECFSGYITRLASRHGVSFYHLMNKLVAPLANKSYIGGTDKGNFRMIGKGFNGIGKVASDVVQIFQELTLRSDLRFTTMLPLRDVISSNCLTRKKRAWCAMCYEECADVGVEKIYDQLIWVLAPVTICEKHKRRLEFECPHCGHEQYHLSSRSRPGYCYWCERWLGTRGGTSQASEKELWIAEQIGMLLAAMPVSPSPTREVIVTGLTKCIEKRSYGSVTRFSKDLPVSHITLNSWLRCSRSMSLTLLSEMCFCINESLSGLVYYAGDADESPNSDSFEQQDIVPVKEGINSTYDASIDWNTIEQTLREATRENPPPQFDKLAKKLKKARKTLQLKFPDLTHRIRERSRNYNYSTLDNERAERYLQAACTEDPPPSVAEIFRRLGHAGSATLLHKRFPDLCKKVSARYCAKFKRPQDWVSIELQLRACLSEEPPPSFHAVAQRMGVNKVGVFLKLPSLTAEISARFRAHKKAVEANNLVTLSAEVFEICRQLYAEDVYPSLKRVKALKTTPASSKTLDSLRYKALRELGLKRAI